MNLRKVSVTLSAAMMLLAPLAARAQGQVSGSTATTPTSTTTGLSTLRPGDVVRLRIWREPDMSGEFTVDESGLVVLPRLGPTQVTDAPVREVKARLQKAFEQFLQPGGVEITTFHRISVVGAVRNPGLYPVDQTMTVADVVALAGGTTAAGKNQVFLVREGARVGPALSFSAPLSQTPLRSGDHLMVPERSFLSRNPGIILGTLSTAASIYWIINRTR